MEGASYALSTVGNQDKWLMDLPIENFSGKTSLLPKKYKRVYKELILDRSINEIENKFTYIIDKKTCDLMHNVDVYFPKKSFSKLNDFLYSIEITIGGQKVDKITATNNSKEQWFQNKEGDLETLINTNAEVFDSKRKVTYTDSHIVVPLHMAPLHDTNLVFPSCKFHEMRIIFEGTFNGTYQKEDIQMYADCYYIDEKDKSRLDKTVIEAPTFQNSTYYGKNTTLKKGVNHFKLNFNHPVHSMYFWGFDKSKVTRIILTLNDYNSYEDKPKEQPNTVYYDGGIEALEYYKSIMGISATPTFFFFSDSKMNERPKSTINFSRLDYPVLTIETEQEDETPFYLNAINIQGYRCYDGTFGLVYSK